MADFPDSAVEYVDTEVYEINGSFGAEVIDYVEYGASVGPVSPTPPIISNVVPAPGTGIYASTPLQFDVTDADTFAALLVYVSFADGSKEVAYDGSSFSVNYRMSITSPITDGVRFVLSKMGGWPSGPSLSVVAVDALGAFV